MHRPVEGGTCVAGSTISGDARALWQTLFVSVGFLDSLGRLTFIDEQGVVTGESRVLHGLARGSLLEQFLYDTSTYTI